MEHENEAQMVMSTRQKWIRMVILALGYMGTGTAYGLPGPSLIDLEIRTSSATKDISLMFLLRACGGLIGSLLCGYLSDIINVDVMLAVISAAAGIAISVAPWWEHVLGLSAFIGIAGLFCAMVNVGVMFYCVSLWGRAHPPYIMLLAFLNSASSSAAIPIVRMSLLPKTFASRQPCWGPNLTYLEPNMTVSALDSASWDNITSEMKINLTSTCGFSPHDVKVQYTFLIPGALLGLACLGHTMLAVNRGCSIAPIFSKKEKTTMPNNSMPRTRCRYAVLLILFGMLAANLGSVWETYSMYLFSFTVKYLNWTKLQAAWPIMALGTSTFIAQVLFIGIAKCFRPGIVMGILQSAMLISSIVMCLPIIVHPIVFWVCIILLGLAFGPAVPTMISWISNSLGPSGKLTAYYFVLVYVSRMATSHSLGHLFDSHGLIWFAYMNMISVGISSLAYGLAVFLTEGRCSSYREKPEKTDEDATGAPMMRDDASEPLSNRSEA